MREKTDITHRDFYEYRIFIEHKKQKIMNEYEYKFEFLHLQKLVVTIIKSVLHNIEHKLR